MTSRGNQPSRSIPNPVGHGGSDSLLAAELMFHHLDRDVPEEELDLFQFPADSVSQTSTHYPEVVRSQLFDSSVSSVLAA